jgi:type II secretory pathway pseudopilin PulG
MNRRPSRPSAAGFGVVGLLMRFASTAPIRVSGSPSRAFGVAAGDCRSQRSPHRSPCLRNGHSVRTQGGRAASRPASRPLLQRGAAGFSFVELLVTIVIAGIVFAAMVPVFVNTQKAAAADRTRNVAVNIAQDRMEKIRLLGFGQILADSADRASGQVDPNLYDPSFAGGQFATPYTPTGSVPFTIDYTVISVPSTGTVNYKRVSVAVAWTNPAHSGSPVTLNTVVMNPAAASTSSTPSLASISSFTPTTGPVGTVVTIAGLHFTGATAVKFNGIAATTFTVVSDTQMTATVPATAASGPITVTTAGGTATSAVNFAVTSAATYTLTVLVNHNYINPTTGVTVTRTDVTPHETKTPSPQFPTTASPAVWSGLPVGTYLVTCNYYKNNKQNGNGPQTRTQTVYVTVANQQLSFDLTQ